MFVRQQDNFTCIVPEKKDTSWYIYSVQNLTNRNSKYKTIAEHAQSPVFGRSLICCRVFWGRGAALWVRCGVPTWSHHHGLVFIITNLKIDPINAGLTMMLHHRYNNAWLGFFHATSLLRATQWARRQANAFWPWRKLIEPIVSGWWQNKLENCQEYQHISLWVNASSWMIMRITIYCNHMVYIIDNFAWHC